MSGKPVDIQVEDHHPYRRELKEAGDIGQTHYSRGRIIRVYGIAVFLTICVFYFQLVVIFDLIGESLRYKPWLVAHVGPKHAGKLFVLGCFFALMSAHLLQAVMWGLFLSRTRLLSSVTEGVYFSAASITTLGYGDILLKYPWRHIGTIIAVTGVLMFGCSTALLFLILQKVWPHF